MPDDEQSGGVNPKAEGNINTEGDVVGRDKVTNVNVEKENRSALPYLVIALVVLGVVVVVIFAILALTSKPANPTATDSPAPALVQPTATQIPPTVTLSPSLATPIPTIMLHPTQPRVINPAQTPKGTFYTVRFVTDPIPRDGELHHVYLSVDDGAEQLLFTAGNRIDHTFYPTFSRSIRVRVTIKPGTALHEELYVNGEQVASEDADNNGLTYQVH